MFKEMKDFAKNFKNNKIKNESDKYIILFYTIQFYIFQRIKYKE